MRKVFLSILLLVFATMLAACGNGGGGNEPATASISGANDITITVGDTFNPLDGVTATDSVDGAITNIQVTGTVNTNAPAVYTLTYKVTGSDGKEVTVTRKVTVQGQAVEPTKIVIMHGAPYEVDPFHAEYSGTRQQERQALQRQVEAELNVIVEYKPYPANAPWGPDRVNAIIQSSVSNNHLADIYWSTSDWIQALAKAEAIVPIDKYMATTGSKIHQSYQKVSMFQGELWAFNEGNLTVDSGLYYNADLVANLGVANPTQLYLDGEWTWTRFETWAKQVKTLMANGQEEMYPLGGMPSAYAESMIPLNGGTLINSVTQRVAFAQNPALQTYDFLNSLYTQGLFETSPQYDAGSPLWQAGKVAMHPGNLWFVTAPNRWGGLPFELGYVPFPKADAFTGAYTSPVSGVAVYHVASGMSAAKEALVFQVWNELQLWRTDAELKSDFELTLMTKFDNEIYVEAYLEVYDKVYLELINALGISAYSEQGWRRNVNLAVREGNARTLMDGIKPTYDAALEAYFNS